jgi:signal transduction histidine kinase
LNDADICFEISITDNGGGISEEGIQNLFMDFSKLEENSAQNRLGTGLGLSICKKITEQMKGSLSVTSKVGMGTSFTFKMITKCKVHCDDDFKSLKDDDE